MKSEGLSYAVDFKLHF